MVFKTKDAVSIYVQPYLTSVDDHKLMKEHLDDKLAKGVIRPSMSPQAGPKILDRETGSPKSRFVIDYRRLNKAAKNTTPGYSLPRIKKVLDLLNGAWWFSTTD